MIARSVTDPKSFALNFLLFAGLQPPAFKFLLDLTLIKVQCSGTLTPPPVHFLVAMRDCLPPSDGCLDRKAFALDLWSLGCIIYLAGEPRSPRHRRILWWLVVVKMRPFLPILWRGALRGLHPWCLESKSVEPWRGLLESR